MRSDRVLRGLFHNTVLVNSLIMATTPLVAVLMLGELGFEPWHYGLAFGLPCLGGLLGSRCAHRLAARFGDHRVLRVVGALRVMWPIGLACLAPGVPGLITVLVVQTALVTCMGVFNPVFATCRLRRIPDEHAVRTLSAWSITSTAATALLTALGGVLAGMIGARGALVVAGVLLWATPWLLPATPGFAVGDGG